MKLFHSFLFFIGAYLLTYFTIPKIIGLVKYKNLMDDPNIRSSHMKRTPTLGGVSFFYTLIFTLFFANYWDTSGEVIYFIPGLTILLMIGLKDDLLILSPVTKLMAQVLAIAFILLNPNLILHSLNGFLGISDVPLPLFYILGGFLMLVIINAYNLIDGIDGLAATVGAIIVIIYATIFYIVEDYLFLLIAISLNGGLIAFLSYNLSKSKKIFMGDTGSLIIGFMISVMTLRFLTISPSDFENLPFLLENAPLVAASILIIPLFDTTRVFMIRIKKGKSPFSADRNHIHHILIDYLSLSHKQASFLLGGINIMFIILFVALGSTSHNIFLCVILIFLVLIMSYFFYKINGNYSHLKYRISLRRKLLEIRKSIKETFLKF